MGYFQIIKDDFKNLMQSAKRSVYEFFANPKNEKAIDTDENECSVVTFERDDKISDERHSALVIQFKPNYNSENDGKDSE